MTRRARAALLLATIIGITIAAATIGDVGGRQVFAAMASIGWIGMIVFILWSGGVLILLGLAWLVVAPDERFARLPLFVWARTTREAATDVLPFSQLGGIVVGVRTLAARGIADRVIYASLIADLTTEMAAQLLFTLGGVAALLLVVSDRPIQANVAPLAIGGMVAMAALMAIFAFAQRPVLALAGKLGARLLPGLEIVMIAVREQLDIVYRHRRRVLAAFIFNLLAWIASAAGAWIALRFMGSAVPIWAVMTIEALIFTLRSVAFAIPGAIGVQEAAYVLIGPIFGLPPATALALSLLKRARDLAIGVPAILVWQANEYLALAGKHRSRAKIDLPIGSERV